VSDPGVPLQVLATDGLEIVAFTKVPVKGLQVVDEVSIVAPEQASLDGGTRSVTQILKVKSEPLVDEILM